MKVDAVSTSEKPKIPLPTLSQINSDRITQLATQYWSPQTKENHLPYDASIVESIYLAEILGSSFSIRRIMMLEFSQYLENYLWPHYEAGQASHAHMMSIIVMINEKFRERVPAWQAFLKKPQQFPAFFEQVLRASISDDAKSNNMREQTALLLFLNHCFGSMEVQLCRDQVKRLVSLSMWISLQEGRRNQEFKTVPKWRKYWRAIQKKDKPELLDKLNWERKYLQRLMIKFMRILESIPEDGDVDAYKIRYCERFLELMIDLEALLPTRRFFNTVMDDCHLVVRCQLAPLVRRIEGQLFTQIDVETKVLALYKQFGDDASILPILHKHIHSWVLKSWLNGLPASYDALEASRPWLVYWILHALWILDDKPEPKILSDIVSFLSHCQNEEGGYGGGPGQMSHLGTTFAAVNALSIIGTDEAYDSIDRSSLQKFLWTVRNVDGSFNLHRGGEVDIRGAYCAVSIAKVTNTYTDALFDKTAEWVVSCQTYEGGFAGCPGMEAHGGYAFCGIAVLSLLGKTHLCDIDALLKWCVNRQMPLEGGFQGRTNKLVDGCYSFWLGSIFPMLSNILAKDNKELIETVLFDQGALQDYIIICCQGDDGGFIDKPGRPTDIYHTCYTLSGLSIAQHGTGAGDPHVVGLPANEINRVDPLHNMAPHIAYNALHYFIRHPPPVKE